MLMNKDGAIAKDLEAIKNLMMPENNHMACFVKYDDLINDPRTQLNRIYNFLEIPYFEHNFNNLSQLNVNSRSYDDKIVGDNMHTIRTNGIYKEDNPYRSMIPKRIVDKYGHIRF
jgi:sulfotransferase